ncbi:MAG TPA: hypothetical protein VFG87_27605 [Amycolatopsis sp.]|jgi:hypothetical protein|nr:hypothetical protein [Amycolatopsis sp.]
MCGACAERGGLDWARPFVAGLPARGAVAAAVKAFARPGLRVTVRGGGWLVSAPTGRTFACAALTELIDAARPWLTGADEFVPRGSGTLTVPGPDARHPVRIRIDPAAPPRSLAEGWDVVVPGADEAHHVLTQLANPPWSLRCYLAEFPLGSTDDDPRATKPENQPPRTRTPTSTRPGAPTVVDGGSADCAADLLVWLEMTRPTLDHVVARCPLDPVSHLDVEIRAGHVVRARAT